MEPSPTPPRKLSRRRLLLGLSAAVLALGLALYRPALRLTADRLVIDHGPGPEASDIIIVLAGGEGQRVDHGVALWRQGRSSRGQLLFSGGPIFRTTTWASAMKDYALQLGVPDQAILLQDRSRTTREDAAMTAEVLRRETIASAILVTDAYHSKRALAAFEAAAPEVRFRSRPVPQAEGDWWRDASRARFVASEYLKRLWPGPD